MAPEPLEQGSGGRAARCTAIAARLVVAAVLCIAGGLAPAVAGTVTAAVAANFAPVALALSGPFEASYDHELVVVSGSTGGLYAQIVNGAPYDVLLAADRERPQRLVAEGLAVPESDFTYAVGRLVLWSADPTVVGAEGAATLRAGDFRHVAIANPEVAPYGAAARQALQGLGVWRDLADKVVVGENIAHAFQMVASGAAPLGLVAQAQLSGPRAPRGGSRWPVPTDLHAPIRQDAVLLVRAAENRAARDFLAFLRSPAARAVIREQGYFPADDTDIEPAPAPETPR